MIKKIFDAIAVAEVLRRLATPFTQTKAYRMHLIDANGLPLKNRSDFTKMEAEVYTRFDVMIFNLKRIIARFTHSPNLAPLAAAALLLKEAENFDTILEADLETMLEAFVEHELGNADYRNFLNESDAPTNVSASGEPSPKNIEAYDPVMVDRAGYSKARSLPKSMRRRKKPVMVVREDEPTSYKFILV